MAIHYPNGRRFNPSTVTRTSPKKTQSNRGMSLEHDLNLANHFYLESGKAVIYKKPTPIQIVKVDYPARSAAKITEAYFRQASTTDYNGIYGGKYIDFDAKETVNTRSFPLKNIHEHQIKHLEQIEAQGGLALLIIRFTSKNETFVVWASFISSYWYAENPKQKSIPYDAIATEGVKITATLQLTTPYLTAVDILINRRKLKEN